jgi:hypothetical protein
VAPELVQQLQEVERPPEVVLVVAERDPGALADGLAREGKG